MKPVLTKAVVCLLCALAWSALLAGQTALQAAPDGVLIPALAQRLAAGSEPQDSPGPDAALLDLASLFSQEEQARAWVRSIHHQTWLLGGLGHLSMGEYGYGALFSLLDTGLLAGMVIGAHAVLPAQVQVQNLDYFASSGANIRQAWESLDLLDLLPALSIACAGGILRMVLLDLEAGHAEELAKEAVRSGKKTFEAQPWLALGHRGALFLGVSVGP